jgi:hypothetical protein
MKKRVKGLTATMAVLILMLSVHIFMTPYIAATRDECGDCDSKKYATPTDISPTSIPTDECSDCGLVSTKEPGGGAYGYHCETPVP